MPDFRYSPKTGRYRGADGRFVRASAVREAVDQVADAASARLVEISRQLRAGTITLETWRAEGMAVIKDAHLAAGIIGRGGLATMNAETFGAIGHRIRGEYGYLRALGEQIVDRSQPLNGRMVARAGMFGQGARVTFEDVRARGDQARGFDEERNVQHSREGCGSCKGQSALGWQPSGTLTPIGLRTCLSACRCTITRRMSKVQASEPRLLRAV